MGARILIVEDDAALCDLLRYNFEAAGFEVAEARTGDEAELLVREHPPELLVLDWMLPGVSGIELCRRIRAGKTSGHIPILMLTARAEEIDRVRGLTTGADDYVTKPFSPAELVARVKALLRRANPGAMADRLVAGDFEIDKTAHKATRTGRDLKLGPTEFRLLDYFMQRPGRVLSRAQLLDGVWGHEAEIDERTVDVHIGRLRASLNRGRQADPIRTVRGAGYVWES